VVEEQYWAGGSSRQVVYGLRGFPTFADLWASVPDTAEELGEFIEGRIRLVRSGRPTMRPIWREEIVLAMDKIAELHAA
jgi:hypothetical protein